MSAPEDAILGLTLAPNDAGALTVGGFLAALLEALWRQGEGFDSKRPFGNSDWDYPIADVLGVTDLDDDDLVAAIRSALSRDPNPVELLVDDIRAAESGNTLTIAEQLIEKGWHK